MLISVRQDSIWYLDSTTAYLKEDTHRFENSFDTYTKLATIESMFFPARP